MEFALAPYTVVFPSHSLFETNLIKGYCGPLKYGFIALLLLPCIGFALRGSDAIF